MKKLIFAVIVLASLSAQASVENLNEEGLPTACRIKCDEKLNLKYINGQPDSPSEFGSITGKLFYVNEGIELPTGTYEGTDERLGSVEFSRVVCGIYMVSLNSMQDYVETLIPETSYSNYFLKNDVKTLEGVFVNSNSAALRIVLSGKPKLGTVEELRFRMKSLHEEFKNDGICR